jgi:hypothetical protein
MMGRAVLGNSEDGPEYVQAKRVQAILLVRIQQFVDQLLQVRIDGRHHLLAALVVVARLAPNARTK